MSSQTRDYALVTDSKQRFLRLIWIHDVTVSALRALWRDLASDPRGLATFDTLIDLRAVRVAMTTEEIRAMAELAKHQAQSMRAIVVSSEADYGLMRMLEMLAQPGPRGYAVFRSIAEACTWLGNPACADRAP
jgi:hypothetical protein